MTNVLLIMCCFPHPIITLNSIISQTLLIYQQSNAEDF